MAKLFFASFVTIGLLLGMVCGVILAGLVYTDSVNLGFAITLTIIINAVIWLISPWISDWSLRWFNKLEFLDDAEVKTRYPAVHQLLHDVARDYSFSAPRIGLIPDRNPTAFTYGLLRSNARIVVTDGIFEFLNEDEQKAVVAHELGHIVNRDFIVMTAAGTLVQILYQVYAASIRSGRSGGKNKGGQALVGIAALVMYYVGIYLLYYLSRTREYLADAFSAERVEARHLASALVKVAYGIVKVEDDESTQSLLQSTRHMGVVDVKNARYSGLEAESDLGDPARASEAMLFDAHNPWARLIELNSTHPLTGMRISALGDIARQKAQSFPDYDLKAAAQRVRLDQGALWGQFWYELGILAVPLGLALLAALLGSWPLIPAAAAIGVLVTLPLRYPSGDARPVTVADLMTNPAASPVVGRLAQLTGKAIGRANPGFIAGEDVIYQDKTGLITADFRSMLGFIGDLFAGWRRVPKHLGQDGKLTGWFRRGMGGYVITKEMNSTAGTLRAQPYFWQAAVSVVVIAVSMVALLAGTGNVARQFGYETHHDTQRQEHHRHRRTVKAPDSSVTPDEADTATPEENSTPSEEGEPYPPQEQPQ
ncbi:M48 family metalloprotease [Hyphomicrobium sp. xq]|uniref:M48 family metalloprotease n=1 Tax=Hyphomicrobium album TaxID=2665159 RepID=A0A6I3KFY4_9HYPH|nr:zinc metalloprotease HtpX [Hyphomicrobium album]MTD93824.1 M48 family metalloprotease [Hyphomicrobium album]